jgi:hypothetical protein
MAIAERVLAEKLQDAARGQKIFRCSKGNG